MSQRQLVDYYTLNLIREALQQFHAAQGSRQVDVDCFMEDNYYVGADALKLKSPIQPLLLQADEHIHGGERVKKYGKASDTFVDVATIATILTGKDLTPSDCLLVQISQKLVRNRYSPQIRDHRCDAAGYLGILDDVLKEQS